MKELDRKDLFLLIGAIESKIEPQIIIPSKDETAVISDNPKTAALYYDRVWCPTIDVFSYSGRMPDEIRFFGGTNEECLMSYQGVVRAHMGNIGECQLPTIKKLNKNELYHEIFKKSTLSFLSKYWNAETDDDTYKVISESMRVPLNERDEYLQNTRFIMNCINRDIARSFSQKYKKEVVTIYPSLEIKNSIYQEGNRNIVLSTIENLKIVDEENITWEQVLEFRNDIEIQKRYKRFLHWLDNEMVGKSQSFIEDELSIRLEDYEHALKKHGIKTILGTVEEALDGKYLLGVSGTIGSFTLAGYPNLGLLLGAGLILGKVLVKLGQTSLDIDDIERGRDSEISWVYEMKKISK